MIGRLCGSEKGESTHGKVRAEGRFLSGTSEAVAAAYMFGSCLSLVIQHLPGQAGSPMAKRAAASSPLCA